MYPHVILFVGDIFRKKEMENAPFNVNESTITINILP